MPGPNETLCERCGKGSCDPVHEDGRCYFKPRLICGEVVTPDRERRLYEQSFKEAAS